MTASDYFPVHAHSEFSVLDGMGSVAQMVAKVDRLGQPGLALTDHGTMAGSLRLYKECQRRGIAPFPGSELYLVTDVSDQDAKSKRYHMGMLALTFDGYKAMVNLSSRSFTRERFYKKPLVDLGDLAEMSAAIKPDDIAITTGCYFGLVQQTLVHKGPKAALSVIKMFASWFPNTFVELQHHDIDENGHSDDELVDAMIELAGEAGLPMVFGQDSHYCDDDHWEAHDLMKSICYFGDSDDYQFPGGPFDLCSVDDIRVKFNGNTWDTIEEGHTRLLELNRMSMPALDKYKFHVPKVSRDADGDLAKMTMEALDAFTEAYALDYDIYADRVAYELGVIGQMGMANYFLLAKREVTDWCRANGIIVETRGSANGSLVCYLLGITPVDPIVWGTSFDRFLSVERKKPPDIDFDIESSRRHEVIEHLRRTFPTLVGIGTYNRMGLSDAPEEDPRGSLIVQYHAARRRTYGKAYSGKVAEEDWPALNELAKIDVRKSLGQHAGGYVLPTQEHPIGDYLATALIPSSNTTVTQAVMEDVEDAGYMKLDLLGQSSLDTMSTAARLLGRDPNDWSWIPWDDKKTCQLLSSRATEGVFQFEGFSTSKGAAEMRIRNTFDAIACLALYRPALMAGGQKDTYLGNRGKSKKNRPYRLNKFFDGLLDITFGVPVFQEQIMEMCLAVGMPFEEWNELMKAVKASNDKIGEYAIDIMVRVKPVFIQCCDNKGISEADAEEAWEAITGFTDYGFNRGHATGYGHRAYRSAYLKAHHPLEYMAALLSTWAGSDKEVLYMREARRLGIAIGRPDVNRSGIVWGIDPKRHNTLRKGLTTIKGIGDKTATVIIDHRPVGGWATIEDFVASVPTKVSGVKEYRTTGMFNGHLEKLKMAGALSSLGIGPDN